MYIQLIWKKIIITILKAVDESFRPTGVPYIQYYALITKAPPPPPFDYFQQRVFFCTNYQCHIDLQNKNFLYFVNCRRNHPYNRCTFWQPPMHPLHSPWNKRTFHTENQVYLIYFKIKNYFELSIHTLYHGYFVKLTLSSDLLCKIAEIRVQ